MSTNLDRYRKDLDSLVAMGDQLHHAMQAECFPDEFRKKLEQTFKEEHGDQAKELTKKVINSLPSFSETYQSWYSEAKALIRQMLPDRLSDFVRHYEKPKPRKELTSESYRIEDYLQGLSTSRWGGEKVTGPDAAIPHFRQQLAILKSVKARFESSLFDIRQLVQADLFDSELDAAKELAKNKFTRAAGALAGVVLERHLAQVCDNHQVKVGKKAPVISDLNEALKAANVIDIPQWRFVQHLADIRNLCDHNRKTDPTPGQVDDLLAGVAKITKTLF